MSETKGEGPLEGLKVVDLTEFMAGPYCTAILADMGADVIKVERPNGGDSIRDWHGHPRNPQFCYMNRNKRSLTLNFKTPEGREILLGLVKQSDVLVENFRATTMERAGFGYETLIAHNPALIYCSISGFGYDGPYRAKGGLDLIAQAMGGIMHVTGEPDGPPTSVGVPLCDLGSGMWAVSGILAALHQRGRTGRGQRVECSLLETAVAYSSWTGAGYLADQKEPRRQGSRHRQSAPYQRFATRDGFVMIGAGSQRLWKRLCAALGKEEWLEDPRFRENGHRVKNRPELEREIEAVLAERPTAHWVGVLDEAGIPGGPVNNYQQVFGDPQVKHREMVTHLDDEELGRVAHLRMPVRLSEGHVGVRRTAPALGQHTGEILAGLGFDEAALAGLKEKQVI